MSSVPYQTDRTWATFGIEWRWKSDDPDAPWSWYVQDSKYEDDCRITTSPYCFQRPGEAYDYIKRHLRSGGQCEYRVVEFEYVRKRVAD